MFLTVDGQLAWRWIYKLILSDNPTVSLYEVFYEIYPRYQGQKAYNQQTPWFSAKGLIDIFEIVYIWFKTGFFKFIL